MKVLQINSVCGYGSTGRIATNLYDALKQEGHDCVIAYGRGTAPEGYKTIKIDSEWEVRLHGLKTRLTDREGFGSRKATERFIKKVKAYDPDVIHLHNLHGYYINIEILFNYLKEADKKVIWTLHDCWAFTGHCAYFDYVGCNKWRTGCDKCPQKKEYPKSFLFDHSKLNYKTKKTLFTNVENMTIVTPSHWLAGLVKESFLAEYPVEVIYNGIDLNVFKPQKSNFKKKYKCEKKTVILGVANVWDRRKGLNTFIRLSRELPQKYQIVMVGVSNKQKRNLPNNIIKISKTNSLQELTEIYNGSDFFLNASCEESFGFVAAEALACGLSVITNSHTANPELISKENGVILDSFCTNNLLKILNNSVKFTENNNIKQFSKKKCMLAYVGLLKEI